VGLSPNIRMLCGSAGSSTFTNTPRRDQCGTDFVEVKQDTQIEITTVHQFKTGRYDILPVGSSNVVASDVTIMILHIQMQYK
jgi:hypothetical protein